MPLTPRFSLTQSPTHVYVEISVPSFRLSAGEDGGMEVVLTGERNSEFHFYAKPYLLKLNFFPNGFVDEDEEQAKGAASPAASSAKYDPSEQTVVVPLRKQRNSDSNDNDIEHDEDNYWSDLDLTARMIEAKPIPKQWLHAVVDETEDNDENQNQNQNRNDDDDKVIENDPDQTPPTNPLLLPEHQDRDGYGFADLFRNVFVDYCRSGLAEEMLEGARVARIDPEDSTLDERKEGRLSAEADGFEFERYLADLELPESPEQDYLYPMVREYEPWWRTHEKLHPSAGAGSGARSGDARSLIRDMENLTVRDEDASDQQTQRKKPSLPPTATATAALFTDDEKLLLSTIPYPLLPKYLLAAPDRDNATTAAAATATFTHYRLWCAAFELVLAYVYDHLTTMGDPSVESSWTISILSCGLSWLDSSPTASLRDTLVAVLRRILVHPYWRNADDLGRRVCSEALFLVRTHRRAGVTKALLQIRSILDKSEAHYLGNKLWVDPCLYWVQNHLRSSSSSSSGGGDDPVLDAIIDEWSSLVDDYAGFASVLSEVEASLGIPGLMEEYFGEEDAQDASSSDEDESSEEDEDDTDDDDDDDDDDDNAEGDNDSDNGEKDDDGQSSTSIARNPLIVEQGGGSPPDAATPVAPATRLLDDQVGVGQASSISSLLHCVPGPPGTTSATTPNATRSSLLIEELPPRDQTQEDEEQRHGSTGDKHRPLIQEL